MQAYWLAFRNGAAVIVDRGLQQNVATLNRTRQAELQEAKSLTSAIFNATFTPENRTDGTSAEDPLQQ